MKTKPLLAVDYGAARCGVAYCNEAGLVFPHQIVSPDELEMTLIALIKDQKITKIVLGLPLSTNGQENKLCESVRQLGRRLKRQLDLPIDFVDERFSSKAVVTKDPNQRIDDQAAAQILEYYLAQQ